ncbi:MAG: hypothetical protein IPI67_02970 [Myxococcales bacterium]|nr:hypothetical protein [Myxococcales bacterium]
MNKTPLKVAKDRFTSKEKLVEAVQKLATGDLWIDRVNGGKGLARVSNAKLVRLHDILTSVKKDFGSRGKLIDAIVTLEKRSKDAGYKSRLEQHPLPQLVDLHAAAARRARRAEAKAKAAPAAAKKKPAAKKAKAAAASA